MMSSVDLTFAPTGGQVAKNSFNLLRGAVHAVGADAPLHLAQKIGELEREHETLLQALPEEQRVAYCSCRAEAMTRRPGSEKWIFPRVMLPAEEVAYRTAELHDDSAADDSYAEVGQVGGAESAVAPLAIEGGTAATSVARAERCERVAKRMRT